MARILKGEQFVVRLNGKFVSGTKTLQRYGLDPNLCKVVVTRSGHLVAIQTEVNRGFSFPPDTWKEIPTKA